MSKGTGKIRAVPLAAYHRRVSDSSRIFVVACAMVAYVVLTWAAFVITLLLGAGFELTLPSFPWWATIFWWIGMVVFACCIAFWLAPRYFAKPS